MILNKMAALWAQSPTPTTKSLSKGYGVDLTHARGICKLGVRGSSFGWYPTGEPYQISFFGDLTEDGRYVIPLHCHGTNMLSGETFAAAVLAAAESSSLVTASLEGSILTFSATGTVPLFPTGFLRGAYSEVFTIMFTLCAPENTGSTLSSGITLTYNYGSQIVSYSGTYTGETVQILTSTNASRQLKGLALSSTDGLPRKIDISTFGIFRGTVGTEAFQPYWGETVPFYLSEPLRTYYTTKDVAYPLQGYAERMVKSTPFKPDTAIPADISNAYPIYRLPMPEELHGQSVLMDRFSHTARESTLVAEELRYMQSAEKDAIFVCVPTAYNTAEKFLNFFHAMNVSLTTERNEPLIERFSPIVLPTRKGRNHIDFQTFVTPSTIDFTYL